MNDTMACTEFEALLPRLLDAEIETPPAARKHLDGCDACRSLLDDLMAIRADAANLPALHPAKDLWGGIDARIQAPVVPLSTNAARARGQPTWRAAGVAAAVLVVATSVVTYRIARQRGAPTPAGAAVPSVATARRDSDTTRIASTPASSAAGQEPTPVLNEPNRVANTARDVVRPASSRVQLTNSSIAETVAYDREIDRLRAVLDSGRTRLDPATVAILERNLTVVDSAIVQCRRALVKDPASNFLIESLNGSYQTKVRLLRIAAAAAKG